MAPASKLTEYEVARLKRMQNNAKYMEEIGVMETKRELEAAMAKPKISRAPAAKPRLPQDTAPSRASNRVALMPAKPSYREMDGDPSGRRGRGSGDRNRNPAYMRAFVPTQEAQEAEDAAIAAAQDLSNPCMVKRMVRSHISSCFWLGLNASFCKDHMPPRESTVILEDQDGKEWESIYKSEKTALSGGWRGFALDHRLDAGDALLFELPEPTRLKVHIFRAIEMPAAIKAGLTPGEDNVPLQPEDYVYERSVYSVKARRPADEEEKEKGSKKRKAAKPDEAEEKPAKKAKAKKSKVKGPVEGDEGSEDDLVELDAEEAAKVSKAAGSKARTKGGPGDAQGQKKAKASEAEEALPRRSRKGRGVAAICPVEESSVGLKGKKTVSVNAIKSPSTRTPRSRKAKAGDVYNVELITEKRKKGRETEWKAKLEGLDEEVWVASTGFLDNKKRCRLG